MSKNKATYIALTVILLIGVGYLISTLLLPPTTGPVAMGPRFFPGLLGVILILLCLLSFYQTRKKEDETIQLPNVKMVLGTLFLTGLFFISWRLVGYFYLNVFLFLMILFTLYQQKPAAISRILFKNGVISLGVTLFIYLTFERIMAIHF